MIAPTLEQFRQTSRDGGLVALHERLMGDQLTPALAYRRLVARDQRIEPSFLFESVETGGRQGRYSILGAQPAIEIVARANHITIIDREAATSTEITHPDPLAILAEHSKRWLAAPALSQGSSSLPDSFIGGWVGYAGYDTVRYLEPGKLPFDHAPPDDRALADLHFALYRLVVVFDHVDRIVHVINHVSVREGETAEDAYARGTAELRDLVRRLETHSVPLPAGAIDLDLAARPDPPGSSNFSRDAFERAVGKTKDYIAAGDAFQVVVSQRFARSTQADPFDIYRALRVVNPSPYMVYLQAREAILVASSPEILCRVRSGVVTSRPLAGTRPRGSIPEYDAALECELLADPKERAEHVMLVDLARNDLGIVCEVGSIGVDRIMEVERYSHVMHLSSTVTGRLRAGVSCWHALRASLPVGTVSGAPKVRAMQIIDEVEPTRRGPYGGGIGYVGFDGNMDIAITLRTMVIPTGENRTAGSHGAWTVHLQAGAGIVADSDPRAEYEETVNKAAALGRAIDLAESAFASS